MAFYSKQIVRLNKSWYFSIAKQFFNFLLFLLTNAETDAGKYIPQQLFIFFKDIVRYFAIISRS